MDACALAESYRIPNDDEWSRGVGWLSPNTRIPTHVKNAEWQHGISTESLRLTSLTEDGRCKITPSSRGPWAGPGHEVVLHFDHLRPVSASSPPYDVCFLSARQTLLQQ